MRATQHSSRTNAAGQVHGRKHNDRNFDVGKADNIDQSRTQDNIYWNLYNGNYTESEKDGKMSFSDAELRAYEELFGDQLRETNEKYVKNRHPERVKTMEDWMSQKTHAPEEVVLQVGRSDREYDTGNHPDAKVAVACLKEYLKELDSWNKKHGEPMEILTMALHMDEAVPHMQIRRTWVYEGDDGGLRQGQEKALERAGVPLPDPSKAPGKRNNRKMTFDSMMREKWLDICERHGLEMEREAVPDARHNMDKSDMIREKYANVMEETARLREETTQLRKDVDRLEVRKTVAKAMAAKLEDTHKRTLLGDNYIVPKREYEDLVRKANGYDAAVEDAIQVRHNMIEDRIALEQKKKRADKEAEKIVQKAREEAAKIVGGARLEALFDGSLQKVARYERLEKRFPEAFEEMERILAAERSERTIDWEREI